MSEQPPVPRLPAPADPAVRRIREYVSAIIAVVIMLGTVAMMIQAFNYLGSPEEFARVKDMLLFINPLLGVVIGYYFNKATSEARAETAETTAQSAMVSARQATEALGVAENKAKISEEEAKSAKTETQEVKATLSAVRQAAQKMTDKVAPKGKVLSVPGEGDESVREAMQELQVALALSSRYVD